MVGHERLHPNGYREVYAPGHPLAQRSGWILQHRMVAFDILGPADQDCHWCGHELPWRAPQTKDGLTVDHLDGNRLNNDPVNLVPACWWCNRFRFIGDEWPEGWVALLGELGSTPPRQRPVDQVEIRRLAVLAGLCSEVGATDLQSNASGAA